MSACPRRPSFRSLDIYRLVVARGLKQCEVARSFGVTPARICRVVRRVRQWVDQSVADWFLPREHRIRFYVALHCEQIRPHEIDADPESVLLVGPGWSYSRQRRIEAHSDGQPPDSPGSARVSDPAEPSTEGLGDTPNDPLQPPPRTDAQLTPKGINATDAAQTAPQAATSSGSADCASPAIAELAHHLAELLILWKKPKNIRANAMTNDRFVTPAVPVPWSAP
jgi:hypothetical protein